MNRLAGLILLLVFGLLVLTACGGTASAPAVGTAAEGSATSGETRVKVHPEIGVPPQVVLAGSAGPAARGATGPNADAQAACLSPAEGELARLINEYRVSLGLPPLQISKSLSLVAQQHAWDSANNQAAWPTPPAGKTCNLHSWTGVVNPALKEGTWTAHCSFADHPNPNGLLDKPKEVAGADMQGIENSFRSSNTATPLGALTAWKNSPGHNGPITQQNGWGPMASMGVGMNQGEAHLWLSWVTDPAGNALLCGGGNPMAPPPTAVPPTAVPPTAVPPTAVPPTAVPPTAVPPTEVPPTAVPPTEVPPTGVPPTDVPPTDVPPTAVPPTEVPPTDVPPTDAPPTAVPPTDVPPTAVPPTDVPPTAVAPTGTVLNATGTVTDGSTGSHAFDLFPGRSYRVVVSPSAEFDAEPLYQCGTGNSRQDGSFDWGWEGEAETLEVTAAGQSSCTIIVGGY